MKGVEHMSCNSHVCWVVARSLSLLREDQTSVGLQAEVVGHAVVGGMYSSVHAANSRYRRGKRSLRV
jgi:hypothetical protein